MARIKKYNQVLYKTNKYQLKKRAEIKLEDNSVIVLNFHKDSEYDICKKNWGFYATPSINSRLLKNNFKTALIKNEMGRYFICIVNQKKIKNFKSYLKSENQKIIKWLTEPLLNKIERL